MNVYPGNIGKLITTLLLIEICSFNLAAQNEYQSNSEIAIPSMYMPHFDKNSRFSSSLGLSMVQPPKDLVEMAIQAPLLNIHMIYALPRNFLLNGNINTIFVSNQFSMGPGYQLIFEDTGLKFGWDVAFIFGRMKQLGFDNTTRGWLHYPNISVSHQWNRMIFTLKTEAVIVSSIKTKTGENEVSSSSNFYNGFTWGFYLEQQLHKNNFLIIGLKDNYVKYYWPTWLAFSTFNRFYHIPELSICWKL